MKNLIGILIAIGIIFAVGPASAELRRVEITCFDRDYQTHHFVLGEIDPTTNFLVKELRIAGSRPRPPGRRSYVLLENPKNNYETRELVWSAGWRCLLERHIIR